jgi:hypothetical protein
MQLTIQAPWTNRRIAENELRAEITGQMRGKHCWQCGKYSGSMLFFDFGGKVSIPSMRRGQIEQGEATLGIRDGYWQLLNGSLTVTDSELIDDENAVELLSCIQGAQLYDLVTPTPGFLNLVLSNNLTLSLDTTNRYATSDHIAEFVLPDGRIYDVTPRGHFYLSDKVSTVRFEGHLKESTKAKSSASHNVVR